MDYLNEFGVVVLFISGALIFALAMLYMGKLIRPNRPNPEKMSTYESGEEPEGTAWANFNIRFYVIALIFLIFEIELVFLFPWAIVFGDAARIEATHGLWGQFALVEMFIFITILMIGLVYVWVNGMLDWSKPTPQITKFTSAVPNELYDKINHKYA